MTTGLNETHDPNLKSWVESANDPGSDFPIQNLPFVQFRADGSKKTFSRTGVRIGDFILDLFELYKLGAFEGAALNEEEDWALQSPQFGPKMWLDLAGRGRLRAWIQRALNANHQTAKSAADIRAQALVAISDGLEMDLPNIRNYTDFYASLHHASTVGAMFRPDNPLLPNYKHVPIGYHGRASSIVVSGTDIRRPRGQQSPPDDNPAAGPSFGPCKLLDYELEIGAFIGPGNKLGEPISIASARDHIFGLCLLNDWSARDIQKWEYQPLGPFLAKNFASTISPYIVTLEALEPFRTTGFNRGPGDPAPLPYLSDEHDRAAGGFDITLEVFLQSAEMLKRGLSPVRLSRGSFKDMFWSFSQMIAHHTSNGCNLQPGDLLGSGTVSGPTPESRGCLLELTWDGMGADGKPKPRRPIELPSGEKRVFLSDGDTVIFKAFCEREGFRRIGFGECRGTILPAT